MIGEVARDFGLYTKITGGQRIDLFGARVEQLPAIWRRLVDAGFESGHAYGKALRTVKSCVGSTWCRYGVQDSVGLAIALELRYRGLRSPHKLKAAVSRLRPRVRRGPRARTSASSPPRRAGTSTSAATAAPRPRHADLLAGDLDTDDAGPLHRPVPHVLHPHRRPAAAHGAPGSTRSTAAWTTCGRSSSTTRSASAPSWSRRWPATSTPTSTSGRRPSTTPSSWRRFVSFVNAPGHPDPNIAFGDRARPDQARADGRAGAPGRPRSRWARRDRDRGPAAAAPTTGSRSAGSPSCEVERGATALVHGQAIAIFRTHDDSVYALGNHDPFARA